MFEKSFQISTADIDGLTPPAKPEPRPQGAESTGARGADLVDSMRPLSEANAVGHSIPRDDLIMFVRAVLENPEVREMHFGNLRRQAHLGSRALGDSAIQYYASDGLNALQANQLGALVGDPENLRRFAAFASQAELPTETIEGAAAGRLRTRSPLHSARPNFDSTIPEPPKNNRGPESGDVVNSMVARYGSDRILPRGVTREIFRDAPPELLTQVPAEQLQAIAWSAVFTVDANAHLNPGWTDPWMRERLIRLFAENMLRQAIERERVA